MKLQFNLVAPTRLPRLSASGKLTRETIQGPSESQQFELSIDIERLKILIGRRVVDNASGRARMLNGIIQCKRK